VGVFSGVCAPVECLYFEVEKNHWVVMRLLEDRKCQFAGGKGRGEKMRYFIGIKK
jgi:hypothetical protein